MNGSIDIDDTVTGAGAADEDSGLDPRQAAELLRQTDDRAKRALDVNPPMISLFGAAIFLTIYGCIYMAARDQHPYTGPKGPWLIAWPVGVVLVLVINGTRYDRMEKRLAGITLRRVRFTAAGGAAALVGIYTIDAALRHAGASYSIVYGVFDAAAPLVVLGSIGATNAAWRDDYAAFGVSVALILIAAGASFAGPDAVWGVIAIGGCLACLGHAGAKIWLARR